MSDRGKKATKVFVWLYRVLALGLLIMLVVLKIAGMSADMPRIDVVTIVLGSTAVMLAVLTIFLAIAAIVGYIEIRRSAHKVAFEAAEDAADRVAAETAERVASKAVQEYLEQSFGKAADDYGAMAAGADDVSKS